MSCYVLISSPLWLHAKHWLQQRLRLRYVHIDGLMQERRNSSALAMELHLSCTSPSRWSSIQYVMTAHKAVVNGLSLLSSGRSLQWRHNGHDSVSNYQPHDCFLNRLFRRRPKKTSKLRVNGLCAGDSPGTGEFPAQMPSNAENVSIWWRHHVSAYCVPVILFLSGYTTGNPLLTWIKFSVDKKLHICVVWNNLSIPKRQRLYRLSLGMDETFHLTPYNGFLLLMHAGTELSPS